MKMFDIRRIFSLCDDYMFDDILAYRGLRILFYLFLV